MEFRIVLGAGGVKRKCFDVGVIKSILTIGSPLKELGGTRTGKN